MESSSAAKERDKVIVKYVCKLSNGKIYDKGSIDFRVGSGQVIRGVDNAVIDMKEGETKTVYIKSKDAYGKKPGGHKLTGKDLIFELTLKKIKTNSVFGKNE